MSSFGPTRASEPALGVSVDEDHGEVKSTIFVVDLLECNWLSLLERFLDHPSLGPGRPVGPWDMRQTLPL